MTIKTAPGSCGSSLSVRVDGGDGRETGDVRGLSLEGGGSLLVDQISQNGNV